jgi:hypothetical protein
MPRVVTLSTVPRRVLTPAQLGALDGRAAGTGQPPARPGAILDSVVRILAGDDSYDAEAQLLAGITLGVRSLVIGNRA